MEKISDITRNKIKDKSAAALPDNPSEAGYTAEEIKNSFIAPITDVRDSVVAEINRLVEEISSAIDDKTKVTVGGVAQNAIAFTTDPQGQIDDTWKRIYTVGSIYQSTNATSPASLFGGTWQRFGKGRVLVGVDENDTEFNVAQKIGGEKAHTLTVAELASHNHPISSNRNPSGENKEFLECSVSYGMGGQVSCNSIYNAGSNQAHNNIQPYITVYMWVRTA